MPIKEEPASGGKKILYFITQSEYGGAQRYCFDLANNLKNGQSVAVAFGEQGNNGKLTKILTENNIKYFIIPHLKRNISPINDFFAFFEIIKLIKNYHPNIIHLNSSKISILGSIAALFAKSKIENQKSKILYTVHGWVFNEPLPGWLKYFYLRAEKFTARFKDKIICVSEFDKQAALKYKIAPASKLLTIHNGLAPINFYSKGKFRTILATVNSRVCHPGLDPGSRVKLHEQVSGLRVKPAMTDTFIIGSIGNLYKTKGYEYFIQAADILINKHHILATFLIIGEGGERKNLEALIKKYHLENNFILAGSIEQAARLLPAIDIYVCSSVKEGLSYTLIEAMQAGRPIAATDVGGNPEMVVNEKTGLLSKPADPNDLAEKIKTLLNNQALAAELGRRAQAKAAVEFNLKTMLEATKRAYN
ncbi:hypothetical protein A3H09_01740 [Candidatus Falkowbacteria bacterium RIFCSPLOWO2_12_FULL_45_13]|uniref:Glycosyltransferase subfamily 4-like N-terminal domain-containing protein n=2 Tax=Candidatus Falkowiibacteriota TaxID=1752728 RepID=A0A1F5SAS8_9BACT|nr:MAG: hypothetical protein A3H66_03490 [Candidatus Falkowbacteria bacterium RIFCSPLOWO2_02_FULL_45_21]OGF30651.1 MAG: hypothetical protein A3H09_01740 [Candidatus Falkowbacteria bacterium RIFCSPLOWO2_12_FULL_45_13]